jgi:hypothetical protein
MALFNRTMVLYLLNVNPAACARYQKGKETKRKEVMQRKPDVSTNSYSRGRGPLLGG